jgi:uncharacterized RDD family membrane protein YckC
MTTIDDIAVLTSENVRLNYTLTGMGSRIAAFLLDSLLLLLVFFAVTTIFILLGMSWAAFDNVKLESFSLLEALYILVMAVIYWGYYFFFEWINWGQTPGKQLLGIRVSAADGAPADMVQCAIRNLIRIVDLILAGLGITFFIMIFTPRYQRIGDLAAGTVVIKRRQLGFDDVLNAARQADRTAAQAARSVTVTARPGAGAESAEGSLRIRVDDAEQALIDRFMERRESLPPNVRKTLVKDLARRIREKSPGESIASMSDEQVIEAAYKTRTSNNQRI